MNMTAHLRRLFLLLVPLLLLVGVVKGGSDPAYYQTHLDTRLGGPFEGSNTTSRYGLTQAIVQDKSFLLTLPLAKFASPDVVDYRGKFLSIFTPGVSLLAVPFYWLGQHVGYPQLGAFSLTLLLAVTNMYTVMVLARKLGANPLAALVAGGIFLFATNALPYATTLTQHHATVTLLLLGLLTTMGAPTLGNALTMGIIAGMALLVDIPNVILFTPIGLVFIGRYVRIKPDDKAVHIMTNLRLLAISCGVIVCLLLFRTYNVATTGSATKIGQTIGRTKLFRETLPAYRSAEGVGDSAKPTPTFAEPQERFPYTTRKQLNGLYTLLLSNERSWLYYSPIVLVGLLGLLIGYRHPALRPWARLSLAIVGITIISYSMFADPWGGWAFGPRYLIPAAAVLCVWIGPAIERYRRSLVFALIIMGLSAYSVWVNTLGAMTTNTVPPKVEAIHLPDPVPYTYEYNQKFLDRGLSSSLVYNTLLAPRLTPTQYVQFYTVVITSLGSGIYAYMMIREWKKK